MNVIMLQPDKPLTFDRQFEDFRTFAIRQHGDQRYGAFPYSIHLAMVENVLVSNNYTDFDFRAAGWLHDVLEDTNTSYDFLVNRWGERIANMVYAVTGEGRNRKERNESIYRKLAENPEAAIIKVADRLANMKVGLLSNSPQLKMYVQEFAEFSDRVRGLMTNNNKSAIMWSNLESAFYDALELVRRVPLAEAA